MRLGEISKSESDDLFGSENPLDRLRKYIKLKLPVYFEHGDDPADVYRDQPIIMANEQNFVYTTKDKGMAYVPWTMPATLYHGGVKIDDWRFVQRNGDWILQQHFSEPPLRPLREESDDLFGPRRRTLTAREMSARMNLAAKQVGLDKILYRSGIADFGSGFEYHPIVSINQDGFQWANRNGTPIWATWEGRDEPRRWQYYRAPGTEGEYIFHLPVYDDDLDESQDDDLFHDQPVFYPGRHSLAVTAPDGETVLRQFSNATVEDAMKYVRKKMANWVAAGYGPDDYFSIHLVDDTRDDPWNEDDGTEEIKRIYINSLSENDDDLFEPSGSLKVVSYDIPREMVYVRSALGLLGVKILNWDIIDNYYFTVDDHEVRSVNNRDVGGQANRNWYTAELGVEIADKFEKYADDWLTETLPDDVRQAMAEKYFLEESKDDLFEPTTTSLKVVNWNIDDATVFVRSALGKLGIQITNWQQLNNKFLISYQIVSVNGRSVTDDQQRSALDNAFRYQVAEQHQDYVETWLSYSIPHEVLTAMQAQKSAVEESDDQELFAPPGKFQKIRQAILDTAKYYGAQLEYLENSPEAQSEVDSETMDALREYIGQAEYVLQEFMQGGIAAFDNALKNVYGEVVDSIDADLYRQGISLDDLINQYRSNLQENEDLFGEIPMWRQVDRLVKVGQPVLFQWAEGVFYPVKKSNQYGFYWENSNGLDINTPWSTYVDHDAGNWTLTPNAAGNMILTDLDYLEESDDLFDELSEMERLRRYFNTRHEIKIADQYGNVWTTVGFLRGRESGEPLMKIQREFQSDVGRHLETLNMTENGLEGAEIMPGPSGKIFVYLKPFERTTIEEAPEESPEEDDMFGEPTRRSKELANKLPAITRINIWIQQALQSELRNEQYRGLRQAIQLATWEHLPLPQNSAAQVLSKLAYDYNDLYTVIQYLNSRGNQSVFPELDPSLLNFIQQDYAKKGKSYRSTEAIQALIKGKTNRVPELEALFQALRTAPKKWWGASDVIEYVKAVPSADAWVMQTLLPQWKDADATALYLSKVHPGQVFPAFEPLIAKKPKASLLYAAKNRRQRWPEVEPVIMTKADIAFDYAQSFFTPNRWVEGEPAIARGRVPWSMYSARFLGTNNSTVKGRADRDRWQQQALAGEPLNPPPPTGAAQINESDDDLFEPQQLPRVAMLKQLINNQSLKLMLSWGGKIYDVVNVEEVPDNDDPYTSHLAGWYEFLVRDEHGLTTITVDPKDHELVKQKDSWFVKERNALVEDGDNDLFEPSKNNKIARWLHNYGARMQQDPDHWAAFDPEDGDEYDADIADVVEQGEVLQTIAQTFAAKGLQEGLRLFGYHAHDYDNWWWEQIVPEMWQETGISLEDLANQYNINENIDDDDDLFEPRGVTPNQINRLIEQHGRIYLQAGAGGMASIWEIEEAYAGEYPGDIELALTTEWGETILRNYPKTVLSIDYETTPPRVTLGGSHLEEAENDLFGEPTKMAYVSRLTTALKNFAQEFTIGLSDEEKKNIKYAIIYYEKGDFIAGNAYLFDLYEDNLAHLRQYLYDRNLLASQQRQLPGTLTLREDDDDLFEPVSPKMIAMALSSVIDTVVDMIESDPISTMGDGAAATRELQLLKYIQQGVNRGHLKAGLELMLDLDDNTKDEIEYQLKRYRGMDIYALRRRYLDENDEDLFAPNQRLQIYRAIRSIADKFEELNTPNLESMQDLVTRYRRIADEFRKSMDQGYRSIWHILSGKYYWQRDLLFDNLKTPYSIDIENEFLDWVEQGRQHQRLR